MNQPMQNLLDLARGPLFAFCLLVMVLGLGRHVILQLYMLAVRKGKRLRNVTWDRVLRDSLGWAFPVRHLIPGTVAFSLVSFLLHIGGILVPVFLADHVVLWESLLGVNLPSLDRVAADVLTLVTIACVLILFALRLAIPRLRAMSRSTDFLLLWLVLVPFLSGFLARQPAWNPLPWEWMMLVHILSAEALMLSIPFTKLSHIVLYPFDRISVIHWQLRPGAGDRVAEAVFGEEVRIQ